VYRIVAQVEAEVFGRTNKFSIDTPFSSRKPEEIVAKELIDDRLQTNSRVLTIDDALNLAVSQSRRFQAEKERLYLAALALTGESYAFGPRFFDENLEVAHTWTAEEENGEVSTERSVTAGGALGVTRAFRTGGRITGRLANDILRFYTGSARESVVSTLSLAVTQPLFRGFGRNNPVIENLKQAERDVIYRVRDFGHFQNDFAVEIVNDYFDLLAQKDVVRNRYTNFLSRGRATERLEARAQDREQIASVDQARQAELSARNNYVNAVASYQNAVNAFKIKLGLPLGEAITLDDNALIELQDTGLIPMNLDTAAAYRAAVQRQLPLLNAIDQFEDSKRKVRLAKNGLLPGVDFFGSASLESEPETDYTRFDPDYLRGSVGVELDLPIDNLPERNAYRRQLVTFEAELRELTLALDTLKDNVERGMRTLEQRRQNYDIQKLALELANRRVASATLLLEAGRAEVRDLIEAQDAQIAAQNAVTSALVSYQETRLQLLLDIGALDASQEKFWLKDHLNTFLPVQTASPAQENRQVVQPPDAFFTN
jgi:outer membrane protein TolC